jgi:hypothetical protein
VGCGRCGVPGRGGEELVVCHASVLGR